MHERGAGEAPVGAHRVGTHEDAELPGHVLDSLLLPRLVLGLQGPPDVRPVSGNRYILSVLQKYYDLLILYTDNR